MAHRTLDRWLLINYAGYPYAPSSLMPDNGLANLAGSLLSQGKTVEILDFATVGTIRRMTSPDLRKRLSKAWETLRLPGRSPLVTLRKYRTLRVLRECESERRALQQQAVEAIGAELVQAIRKKNIQAVGFKLWNGDGLEGSGRMAAIIRQHCPEVKLFGGGPHVDLFMDRVLSHYTVFDALQHGEGEETILHLAESGAHPESYPSLPNLLYRSAAGRIQRSPESMIENLDTLPLPVYDPAIYPAMAGDEKVKIIVIDESRGCRNSCAFCVHPVKSNQNVRVKGLPRLINEVRQLDSRYGYRAFRFAGSCTPYSLLNGFAGEILRQQIPIRYASFAHIRESDEADFGLIRKSGCVSLFFGIESGSQKILDGLGKGIKVEQTARALHQAKAAGIFTVGSVIFPAPGETPESEAQTLSVLQNAQLDSLMLQAPIVAPRTEWFKSPEKYGIHFPDRERYLEVAMGWKVKLQLPPRFWDTMPIEIDGQTYPQILARTSSFARKVSRLGIPTSITDETYLMSVEAGMEATEFRDTALAAFYSGETEGIETLVRQINSGAASR
jgi:hypothetical protein